MKKVIWSIVAVLLIVIGVAVGFQMKINKVVASKVEELNNNGFIVKHEASSNYIKTNGKGEAEVLYPDKVIAYLLKDMENQENKKAIETEYDLLSKSEKEMIFDGLKFDYDFVIDNLKIDINLNVYLTSLSKKAMYNLEQEKNENKASQWLLDFLKEKKLKVNIDKNGNYKLADIDTVIPEMLFITIRGLEGNSKNFKLPLFKISSADNSKKEFLQFDNINVDYEITQKKENSKLSIGTLELQESENKINIKNLVINSSYEKDDLNISAKSQFSFDEIYAKNYQEDMNFKNSSIDFAVSKFPIKTFEEIKNHLEKQKYDEYLKSVAQSGATFESTGSAATYTINGQKIIDTLKYNLSLQLNKNGSIENAQNIKDIFEKIKLTVDLDETTALNLKTFLAFQIQNSNFDFVDGQNNLKRFNAELKTDGIYVNDKKILDENYLVLPKKDTYSSEAILNDEKGLTYDYKFLDNNQVQIDFKYSANMKSISSGGISISFPQLKDSSRIIKHTTKSFDKINFYNAGTQIWNGQLQKNVKASYLLAEGWDENWTNSSVEKEFSLIVDIKDLDVLQINLRAGALNNTDNQEVPYETVPETGDLDQQGYPIEMIEIPLKQ